MDAVLAGSPLQLNHFCAGNYGNGVKTILMTCVKVITGRYITVQKMRKGPSKWVWTLMEIKIIGRLV